MQKWCDTAYFLAQVSDGAEESEACRRKDHCMKRVDKGDLHPLEFATRLVVMAFVRATCSRGGSVCKYIDGR
eukprot:4864146-Prymnesium_polylepis.1